MIRSTRLENGILVLTENMPGVRSASIGCWFKSGSRHEPASLNGITHFVEHMLFRGTERRTAQQIAREIDAFGGFVNAFTSQEFCCVYSKTQGERLNQTLDLLADMLLNSTFSASEIIKEQRVIEQELRMVEETPDDRAHELFNWLFWQGHSLGRPTAGSIEGLAHFDRPALLKWKQERFTSDRLIICAAGDVSHEGFVELVFRLFENLRPGDLDMADPPPKPTRRVCFTEQRLEQVYFCLGTSGFAQSHPDRFAAFLLNAILGGEMSSRLYQVVRERHGLAYSIQSGLNTYLDSGNLVISCATAPKDFARVLELVLGEMADLRQRKVDEDVLQTTRECLKGRLALSLESTDNRMSRLARNEYYLGRQVDIDSVLDAFDRVTPADIQRVAAELFRNESLVLQVLGPVGDLPAVDQILFLEEVAPG